MKEAKFKIDDHVKATSFTNLEGYVIDALWSESTGWNYRVQENNHVFFFPEDDLELIPEKKNYSMQIQIDIANNVVIATMFEFVGGGAEAHPQGTRSSDSRRRIRHCPGCKLCLYETVQEHGRV